MDKRILVAIDEAWREDVSHYLEERHFHVVNALTYDDAITIVHHEPLVAAFVVSNWMVTDKDTATELAGLIIGKIPSVTLIRKTMSYAWFEIVYKPPNHEYSTIPLDRDVLILFLKRIGVTAGD